jgi:hypothetical protein
MTILAFILQAVIAIVIVLFVLILARWAMNNDIQTLGNKYDEQAKTKVAIINGQVSNTQPARSYNTRYTSAGRGTFLPIKPSINRKGGAQFTYSFWLNLEDPAALLQWMSKKRTSMITTDVAASGTYTLFLHGDRMYHEYVRDTATTYGRIAVCPAVYLNENMDLIIEFNTSKQLKERVTIESKHDYNTLKRHNLTSLQPNKWTMYTIMISDNMPASDFEDGIQVRTYVNETFYNVYKSPNATLMTNQGLFWVFPDQPTQNESGSLKTLSFGSQQLEALASSALRMSDLTYYNYVLSDADIAKRVKNGPNLNLHIDETKNNDILSASAYNKLDIYNL